MRKLCAEGVLKIFGVGSAVAIGAAMVQPSRSGGVLHQFMEFCDAALMGSG